MVWQTLNLLYFSNLIKPLNTLSSGWSSQWTRTLLHCLFTDPTDESQLRQPEENIPGVWQAPWWHGGHRWPEVHPDPFYHTSDWPVVSAAHGEVSDIITDCMVYKEVVGSSPAWNFSKQSHLLGILCTKWSETLWSKVDSGFQCCSPTMLLFKSICIL